jgi:low affinity Fe/Cu permease
MASVGIVEPASPEAQTSLSDRFASASNQISAWAGSYKTFLIAILVILIWAISGPIFKFSDTWQLVINTGTTIITFLMVFLIQNTQNRDAVAVHLKLDELIRAIEAADDRIMAAETVSETKLSEWHEQYAKLTEEHAAMVGKAEEVKNEVEDIKEEIEHAEAAT